jgi:hypothetical protein
MSASPLDDGLRIVGSDEPDDLEAAADEDGRPPAETNGDADLENLRDEFVDGFNARDLEALMVLVHANVECPDIAGDGAAVLAEELESLWERSPGAMLTRGFLDGAPCGIAWVPDEDGCWIRAGLVCFDADDGLLSLVSLPDDADALERAEGEEPTGEELEEWSDWGEWERGEETIPHVRP